MRIAIIVTLLALLAGCACYDALDMDTLRSAHNRIRSKEIKGLVLAAEDYSAPAKCLRYFQRDLLELGYIPIFLSICSHSDYEFSLRRNNMILVLEDGLQAQSVEVKEVVPLVQSTPANALFSLPLAIFPAIFLWDSIEKANAKLDRDYWQKMFRDSHVRKGDKVYGFLIFRAPPGKIVTAESMANATLEVAAVQKAAEGKMGEVVKFVLSIERGMNRLQIRSLQMR